MPTKDRDLEVDLPRTSDPSVLPLTRPGTTAAPFTRQSLITRPWRNVFRPEFPRLFSTPTTNLRSTAHLDGLRGIAALIVYVAHTLAWRTDADTISHGFGFRGNFNFITFPFIRVFFTSGHAAVAVFFVISGFVLSHRPMSLIHRQSTDLYPALSSAIFRRGIRLYVPFVAITFAYFTSWHVLRYQVEWPKPHATYLAELAFWWSEFSNYINPLRRPNDTWYYYNFPLWTIPIEFQGSLLVFLCLLSFARLSPRARLSLTFSLALYFLHIGLWHMWCFLLGLMLAELSLLQSSSHSSLTKTRNSPVMAALFVAGMYLASQPSDKSITDARDTPGWHFLCSLVPETYIAEQWWRFWLSFAAPMLVYSVSHLQVLRVLLESRLAQYFGRISFGLYLVHIPLLVSVGDIVYRMIGFIRPNTEPSAWDSWMPVPSVGPLGLTLDVLVPQIVLVPLTLYTSEVVMKLVDEPSVILGKQIYDSLTVW